MLRQEKYNGFDLWVLAHPKANAFDVQFANFMARSLAEAAESSGPVILTAEGRIFSAGVDLRKVVAGGAAYVREFVPAVNEMFRTLLEFPRPIIAAINGHAIAGGCILAAGCDWRIMAQGECRIGLPESNVGVPIPVAAMEVMRFAVGTPRLQWLLHSGQHFLPDEAAEIGLIDDVAPVDQLLIRAAEVAERFSRIPAPTFALTKRQIRAEAIDAVHQVSAKLLGKIAQMWARPETLAAVEAFVKQTLKSK